MRLYAAAAAAAAASVRPMETYYAVRLRGTGNRGEGDVATCR